MWEEILKAKYSSKHFKELKGAVLRQIEDLEIGRPYTIDELLPLYLDYYTPTTNIRGAFTKWWEYKGRSWYSNRFAMIGVNSGKITKGTTIIAGQTKTSYTRIDPNAEQE